MAEFEPIEVSYEPTFRRILQASIALHRNSLLVVVFAGAVVTTFALVREGGHWAIAVPGLIFSLLYLCFLVWGAYQIQQEQKGRGRIRFRFEPSSFRIVGAGTDSRILYKNLRGIIERNGVMLIRGPHLTWILPISELAGNDLLRLRMLLTGKGNH